MSYTVQLPFGAKLIISVKSDDSERDITRIQGRLHNRKALLKTVANAMRLDIRRQFKVGGDPQWKELSPLTVAAKNAAGLPARTAKGNIPRRLVQNGQVSAWNILIATGRLRDSWGTLNSPDHVEKIDEASGEIHMGSKVEYAATHQFGRIVSLKGKSVGIPARPVRSTAEGKLAMIAAYQNYLDDTTK